MNIFKYKNRNKNALIIFIVLILIYLLYKTIITFLLFNDIGFGKDKNAYINNVYKNNNYYKIKYNEFYQKYDSCT